ncbi:lipase family protein [Xanthobacter sediminis]
MRHVGAVSATLGSIANAPVGAINQDPAPSRVFTAYTAHAPSLYLDNNRETVQVLDGPSWVRETKDAGPPPQTPSGQAPGHASHVLRAPSLLSVLRPGRPAPAALEHAVRGMTPERMASGTCAAPFPVYPDLAGLLLAAHLPDADGRDGMVAHVLATFAGYAYADTATMSSIMGRLGLEGGACVRVAQTVDAMYIHSTAYLLQSRCGRVVVLCYRGTEPATPGNWIADTDVGAEAMRLWDLPVRVHAGFHRNLRATRWAVLQELRLAVQGRSLLDPTQPADHPLQALYVTGHSFGGALAALFALSVAAAPAEDDIFRCLRATYTYGQPLTVGGPLPAQAAQAARGLWRHVMPRDPMPALPPGDWGGLAHFGHEYRWHDEGDGSGTWQASGEPVAQAATLMSVGGALIPSMRRRSDRQRYVLAEHRPHCYIDALRPHGLITEYGEATPPQAWPSRPAP